MHSITFPGCPTIVSVVDLSSFSNPIHLRSGLSEDFKKTNTVTYNELRVEKSIVDIAVFNGESSAFEIKTEFDSPRRLEKQLDDYQRLFDKCYVVVPKEKVSDYIRCVDERIGVMSLSKTRKGIFIHKVREAVLNETIDSDLLISCLRTKEYEQVIKDFFGNF